MNRQGLDTLRMRSIERDATMPSMISRVSMILRLYLREESEFTVSEISRRTGIPKASVSRIARDLVDESILERDGDHFRLGIRLFELGQQASRTTDLRRVAAPYMYELMSATKQTVHLAVLEGTEVVYVHRLRSKLTPPLPSRIGGRLPAHATGVGKVLLAFRPLEELDRLGDPPLAALGPRTITDPEVLRSELHAIRMNRLAYEREESVADVGCAASPVLDANGRAIAALSVSVHLSSTDLTKMGPAVAVAARALSRQLGAPGQPGSAE